MSSRRQNEEPRTTAYLYLEGNPKPIPLFDKFQFGRMESFDNPAVSRTHFTIAANEYGVYYILDHESRAGTRLNSNQIKPGEWHELEEGFLIAVGPYTFEFSFKPAHKRSKTKAENKNNIKSDNKKNNERAKRSEKHDERRRPDDPAEPLRLQKVDTGMLLLDKAPRLKSPAPKRPRRDYRPRLVETDEEYAARLRLFLMICAVITVLTAVAVQTRKQSSREQMLPYYAGYTNVVKQYYKNYGQYQKQEKSISVYERDQNRLVKQLQELEADLRTERSVDQKADYYKKHMLYLLGKTLSHSLNSLKFFRTGKFNYFSLAKQDNADIHQEMKLLNKAFGVKHSAPEFKERESELRLPAATSGDIEAQSEDRPKKARDKKTRAPF